MIEIYKKMYNLKTLEMGKICENTISFIFFDEDLNYYLSKNNNLITYKIKNETNVIDIIKKIEKQFELIIYNCYPLCFIKNNSIIFACKIKTISKNLKLYNQQNPDINKLIKINNKKSSFYSNIYDDEYVLLEKYKKRYLFYQNVIKKYFLTDKKRKKAEYMNLLRELIGNKANKIIDVSCGDNDDLFVTFNDREIVVGNDINLYHLKMNNNIHKDSIFTNDNILDFSFSENFFDVSYCKNTLHHLKNLDEYNVALKNMLKISKKCIVVEIENPQITGGFPKFLNKYLYIKFLKDAGKKFISSDEFKKVITDNFNDKYDIKFSTFENILGRNMIAIIEKR